MVESIVRARPAVAVLLLTIVPLDREGVDEEAKERRALLFLAGFSTPGSLTRFELDFFLLSVSLARPELLLASADGARAAAVSVPSASVAS